MSWKTLTVVLGIMMLAGSGVAQADQRVGEVPIQHHGRIKPLAAFAQESLQFVSGKKRWHGQDATALLMIQLAKPEGFLDLPFVRVDHPALKKMMGLPLEENYFTARQLQASFHSVEALLQGSAQKREKDARPLEIEQQAETLYQRLVMVDGLSTGELITVIPGEAGKAWRSPFKSEDEASRAFQQLIRDEADQAPAGTLETVQWLDRIKPLLEPGALFRIKMEALYYRLQPFYNAGVLYFLGFILLLFSWPLARKLGSFLLLAGFLFHLGGIVLRWVILMRPPVANMYETMIFMDLVLMTAVGIPVLFQKRQAFLSSGAIASGMVMLFANLLPVDQSLDVLTPVLRSSYWLTIHVITIISSYSFFALAMAVSHRHLFLAVRGKLTADENKSSAGTINRFLQIGLITLGAGTILGGVWANEAWGRFWGWDPKETWAFITFLGYMAIMHLRYRKQLSNFGLAVSGILGFLLVMMTWYGVNFVLGRGMHSYGSGSGGLKWIVYYLVFEAFFLAWVMIMRQKDHTTTSM